MHGPPAIHPATTRIAIILALLAIPMISIADEAVPPDTAPLVGSINQFALALYPKSGGADQNLIFSPYSIHLALAMTAAGAGGDTLKQMQTVLDFPGGDFNLPTAAGNLMLSLQPAHRDSEPILKVANALWAQQGFDFSAPYLNSVQKDFRAKLASLDFTDAESARKTINDWVAQQTNDKIKDLLGEGSIEPHVTKLVLTNAVYFKADWIQPFDKNKTQDGDFHANGKTDAIQTPMMHETTRVPIMQNDQFQAIELPYVGDRISMLILLPKAVDGLGKLESNLDAAEISDIDKQLSPDLVAVSLPKFQFKKKIDLNPVLQGMGISDAFDPNQADFSGMDGKRDLFISDVVHQAFVAVDEKGTEAAAATGISVGAMAIIVPQNSFNADHPFLFLIRDKQSGLILFMGRVQDPSGQ
jgi:serpin B